MKRMVSENLIAILKEMDSKGISVSDLADTLSHLSVDEDNNLVIGSRFIENESEFKSTMMRRIGINFLSEIR